MSVAFLEKKKKAIEEVIQAYRSFKTALQELPPDWAQEILEDLRGQGISLTTHSAEHLPSPTEAVEGLLRKYPAGLRAKDIIVALDGKFRTTSDKPTKLLYSVLTTMRRNGKLSKTQDKKYRLPS